MSSPRTKTHRLPSLNIFLIGVWVLVGTFFAAYVWFTYSTIHLAAKRAAWEQQQNILSSEAAELEEQYLSFESSALSERARALGLASAQERISFVERRNTLAQRAASLSY